MGPNQSDWDRVLHERLVAGDGEALVEVYDAHAPVVYGLAIRVTGDHTAAEDITQDVFVRLWERPEDFDPCCGRLRTWLCTVARRRAIDWIRRARTRDRSAVAFWPGAGHHGLGYRGHRNPGVSGPVGPRRRPGVARATT